MQDPVISGNKNALSNSEGDLLFEINASKLTSFGKEWFQANIERSLPVDQFIKFSAQHQSLNLPIKINEFFISRDTAKYLWVCNLPLITELEKYSPNPEKKNNKSDAEKAEIRKYYIKWLSEKVERERIFFAGTVKNLIEKGDPHEDIIKHLFNASICVNEKKFYSSENFFYLVDYAKDLILNSNIDENIKTNLLYYINVYKAFFFINEKSYEEARGYLQNALEIISDGITAQFYISMVSNICGDKENSIGYINNVVQFDIDRFSYAINLNRPELFQYFLSNAITYQYFREKEFGGILPNIKTVFESLNINEPVNLKRLSILISKLKDINITEYFDDQVSGGIIFLESFINKYSKDRNIFIKISENALYERFNNLIEMIKNKYRSIAEEKMVYELSVIDKKILVYKNDITSIQSGIDKQKEEIKTAQKEAIEKNEKSFNTTISDVESSISSIDQKQEFNPFAVFNNSLIYNFIISLIVFIVGGFVDGVKGTQLSDIKISEIIPSVFISGLKWSSIVFVIGLVIAVFTMVSKVIEKSNEKQKLLRKISQLKAVKERETEAIKRAYESNLKEYDENIKLRIERIHELIESMEKEKRNLASTLKVDIDKTVEEFNKKLSTLFV